MRVHHNLDSIPAFRDAVVTIGTFDGVHAGHQQILLQLKEEAAKTGGETVIITFHPHPRKVVQPAKPPIYLINTIDERIELLERSGINHLVVIPFTEAFSRLSAQAYVEDFLIAHFHPHTIIIGYDHHFGEGRKGNYKLLEEYAARGFFLLKEIPEHIVNNNAVSSTRIREAILRGNVEEANVLLGYDFFFSGRVIEGRKLGRKLGYPTANLHLADAEKIIPGNGIYIAEAELAPVDGITQKSKDSNGKAFRQRAMMSIGVRPTIGGTDRTIEVNIFDFDRDIYGETLRVYVKKYLRPEEKFNDLEALKEQLNIDKNNTLKYFSSATG